MNIFALSNVEVHPEVTRKLAGDAAAAGVAPFRLLPPSADMCKVVMRLAMGNPQWRFVVSKTTALYGGVASEFIVIDSGEEIGKIGKAYYRGGYKLAISNARISDQRERADAYRTEDVDKAILMAKKMFSRLDLSERVAKAELKATRVMGAQGQDKSRNHRKFEYAVHSAAAAFIQGEGFPLFLAHVDGFPMHERLSMLSNIEGMRRLSVEMLTIEAIRNNFGASQAILIIKDEGKYLVKTNLEVQVYDDNTLPEYMRRKLGMLKLVEAEHFISDVGCRINDEIFVLTQEA